MAELSLEQQAKVRAMLKEGKSHVEIARILNVSSLVISAFATSKQLTELSEEQTSVASAPHNTLNLPKGRGPEHFAGVLIGVQENGEQVYWDPFSSSNPHLMVVGESGTGKTYALTAILAELWKQRLPSFIIDYSNSFAKDKFPVSIQRSGYLKELKVVSEGLRLNPMQIRLEDVKGPTSVAVRIAETIHRIYNPGHQQRAVLVEAIIEVFRRHGITDESTTWALPAPHLSALGTYLDELSQDEEFPRRSTADTLRARISDLFVYDIFRPDGLQFDWQTALDEKGITILQLQGLEGLTKKVVVEFLLWDLFGFMMDTGEKPLTAFVVLDEAHNLSFGDTAPIGKILREARKFGLGTIVASQQPEDFSEVAMSNTNTKICFQVSAERGRFLKRIAARSGYPFEKLRVLLTTMGKYHAFVLAGNKGRSCRVLSFEERGF